MANYNDYLERAQSLLAAHEEDVVFKPVFGAAAAYIDGAIFLTSGQFGVALKFSVERCAYLIKEKGGAPLKYFEKGHVKKGYVVLPDATLANTRTMRKLIAESMDYCRELS